MVSLSLLRLVVVFEVAYMKCFAQRWPGHVKARHFVLALHDYYHQELEKKRKVSGGDTAISRVTDKDEWALEWISLRRMQAIVEAFDDDASGFITIAEVNHFTASRPQGWRYV